MSVHVKSFTKSGSVRNFNIYAHYSTTMEQLLQMVKDKDDRELSRIKFIMKIADLSGWHNVTPSIHTVFLLSGGVSCFIVSSAPIYYASCATPPPSHIIQGSYCICGMGTVLLLAALKYLMDDVYGRSPSHILCSL